MAVYPDRIVLKNSTDTDAEIRTAIAVGGTDEIYYGEIVLGLAAGNARLYTRDSGGNIVAFGGSDSESTGGLNDVDLTGLADSDILQWIESEGKFRPKTIVEAGALSALSDDSAPLLAASLNVSTFGFEANTIDTVVDHNYYGRFRRLKLYNQSRNADVTLTYAGTQNITFQLPPDAGTSGYALVTDGNGVLSWSSGVAADLSLSTWDGLSDITLTDGGANIGAVWGVSDTLGRGRTLFRPLSSAFNGSSAGQGLQVNEDGFVGLYNETRGSSIYINPSSSGGRVYLKSGQSVYLDSYGLRYESSAPARSSSNQFTTFGDLDDLETTINASIGDITIGDLSDVDLTTIPPIAGQTLVYSATAQGGSGGWISASLPGTGTVTSVDLSNTGGLSISGGPVVDNGTIDIGLESLTNVAGSYSAPNLTVDEYGRVISITSGGNGAGVVTSVNGETGDVSLSVLDLSDVRATPATPATGSPDVDGVWTIQALGGETLGGNGRWKLQLDPFDASQSLLSFNLLDGTPLNWTTAVSTVIAGISAPETYYLQITFNEFTFEPIPVTSVSSDGTVATVSFLSSLFNVGLVNGGDAWNANAGVRNQNITLAIGDVNAFSFGGQSVIPGQILLWKAEGFFEPHNLVLSDATNVSSTTPSDGQALVWNNSLSTWVPGTVQTVTELSTDSSPQLGGDLDLGLFEIVTVSNRDITLNPDGTGNVVIKGNSTSGSITLNCTANTHGVTIESPPHSDAATYTLILPSGPGTAGQVLTSQGGAQLTWENPGSGGGTDITTESIDALSDVDTTTTPPTDGQVLVWDNANSKWEPGTVAGGTVASLDDIGDVDTTTSAPSDGQTLVWNNTASQWEPGSAGGAASVPFDAILKYTSGDATNPGEWQYWSNFGANDVYLNFVDNTGVDATSMFEHLDDSNSVTHIWHSGDSGATWTKREGTFAIDAGLTFYNFNSATGEPFFSGDQWFSFADPTQPNRISSNVDVDTTTVPPTDGQVLVWDNANSQWEPGTVAGGTVASLDNVGDVDTTTVPPTDGQALVWDNANSQWEPGTVAGGGAVDSVNGETGVVSLGIQDQDDVDVYTVLGTADARNYNSAWPTGWPDIGTDQWGFGTKASLGGIDEPEIIIDNTPAGTWVPPQWTGSNLAQYRFTFNGSMSFVLWGRWVYQDGGARYIFDVTDESGSPAQSDYEAVRDTVLAAGTPTTLVVEQVESNLSDGSVLQWNDTDQKFKPAQLAVSGGGAVDSVNGETGVVSLGIQDMDDFALNPAAGTNSVTRTVQSASNNVSPGNVGTSIISAGYSYWCYNPDGSGASNILSYLRDTAALPIDVDINGTTVNVTEVSDQAESFQSSVNGNGGSLRLLHPGLTSTGSITGSDWTLALASAPTSPLADGDLLQYVSADSAFKPARLTVSELDDVDTDTTPPTDGQVLTWVNANSQWEPGTVSSGTVRTTASITSSSLANGANENLTITGTGKAGQLLAIEVDQAAWVTVYCSQTARTSDAARLETEDPDPGSGILAEIITTGAQQVLVTPAVNYFNFETVPADEIYIKVVNKSGTSNTITTTLSVVPVET